MVSDRTIVIILTSIGMVLIISILALLLPRLEVFIVGIIISIIIIFGMYMTHRIIQDHKTRNKKNYV
jgi:lipopolysaccharide export LptBFGC system permease protein LptF